MPSVLFPPSATELSQIIGDARRAGRTLRLTGGGSKDFSGAPRGFTQLVSLSGMSKIIDYDPAELVLTALAGTPLSTITDLLRSENQMLPFEPAELGGLLGPARTQSTLGGLFATNLSGSRRLTAGSARDHLLGVEAVSGTGEIFKAGSRVIKNVTGFDLPRLLCGSWGSLAAMTTVTIKVLPKPASEISLAFGDLSDAQAAALMNRAARSSAGVTCAAHLPEGCRGCASGFVILRLEGFESPLQHRSQALADELGVMPTHVLDAQTSEKIWADIRTVHPILGKPETLWRVLLPPIKGWEFLGSVRETIEADAYFDWAGGLVWLSLPTCSVADALTIRSHAEHFGGTAQLLIGPEFLRLAVPLLHPASQGIAHLEARLRHQFDPDGVLDPSRAWRTVDMPRWPFP